MENWPPYQILAALFVPLITYLFGRFAKMRDTSIGNAELKTENLDYKQRNENLVNYGLIRDAEHKSQLLEKDLANKVTIDQLQAEIIELQRRLSAFEDKKKILAEYPFDPRTSTRTHLTDKFRYCHYCINCDPPNAIQVSLTGAGWYCWTCRKTFFGSG